MNFSRKLGSIHFFLLYLWEKYELIWSDITAQTVSLGANLLVKAQNHTTKRQVLAIFLTKSCGYSRYLNFEED